MMQPLKDALFIILIAVDLFHLSGSQPPCITPPLPSLKAQGEFCKDSSECVSYVCKKNVCTCPESTYFDLCTQSCVNNCNSTFKVETSGHIVRLLPSNTSQQSQYCTWSLEAPAGSFILFRIAYLDGKSSDNCSTDFVEVYDGQEPRYRFCQSNETDPKVVASASNKLDITYQESSPGHYGFIGSYYLYSHNSTTRDRFGYIASPRYPQKYPPNYVVSWTIDGGEEVVTFSIQKMEMKDNENDFITVYDGPNTRASNRVRFGRDKGLLSFTSTSNFLHIVFQSDGSFEFPGFYASFKVKGRAEGKSCNVTHVCLENMSCINGHCSCGQGQFYNTSSSLCIPGDPKIQDDLNNITTNYTDQTQTDERPSSSFHWTTTMDTVVDPKIQDDLNNITTHYTLQTQTDERASSSFHWTTTMDTVATPRPKNCPRDVKVRSMGQDSVTFMWRHQAQYDDTEFRIAVFDNASNRISAPNSPQVSDGAYTYISVTSLDHTTDYRFKIESTLSNVTEYVCDDELPKIVFCPEDSQEEVTFVQTRGGVTRQVPCPPNYEGNITRTCNHKTGSWTPFSQYNCARKRLIIASNLANDLSNESSEVLKARVKDISSEVTSALEGNITIVSGEIKQIVNILEQIGIASNRSSVSNDTLQRLAAITDKLIEADTSTWDELSSANKTENAGSVLLKAMEDITSSYLHSANVTDTLIQEKNIVITVASTGQGRDNITFPKMDQATYNTNQTLNKVFLSSEALSGSVAYSVIIYMNVSDKFKVHSSSNESSQEQRIGTDVISFSLSSKSTSLSSPLILTFKTGESRDGAVCSFLDTKNEISGVWLSDGCKTILKETTIDCQCSHLTNFAVLMSMTRLSPDHHTILSYISVIGLSISLFFLCLTVTVYSVMWRYVKSDKSVLHINLCVCLMLGYTVFLGGISRTEHRVACAVAAALLHYLFLAVFFVMLSQGLLILKSVTSVSSVSILRYLYIIMYGAPLVIVATSLGITQGEGFGTDKACWLSPQKGVLWAFVGPALSIVVVNFFILFAVIRIMQKSRIMTDKDVKKKTKSVVRSIFILSPILGVTWVLGVLSATMELAIFQYAFAISNSLQGLFIFIFQCVLQYQIKDGFRALLRRYRATSFDSSQRMVSTGQSQEKGYSESGQKTTSITNTSGSYMSKE